MNTFWAFVLGLVLGTLFGVIIAALLKVAKDN